MVKSEYWTDYLYMSFPSQLPVFALGILLFYLTQDFTKRSKADIIPQFYKRLSSPLLVLFFILLLNNSIKKFSTDGLVPIFITNNALLFLLFIFSLYLSPNKLIVNPATTYLGKISYSLYLTHAVAIHFTEILLANHVVASPPTNYALHLAITLVLTLIFSNITYYLIEKPGQNIGKKLINKLERSTALPEPPSSASLAQRNS
jgi:peptidoglycan/LPS O-acetylase OafA/YrhL